MTDKLLSIQSLRGIAVLLVVVVHLRQFELRFSGDHGVLPPWTGHFQCGVDLFFVISGYVMVAISHGRKDSITAPAEFLARRALRILPLYWTVTLLMAAVAIVLPQFAPQRADSLVTTLIKSLALWPDRQAPLIGQGWSLIHEMYFYTVFAVGLMFQRIRPGFLLLSWGLVAISGAVIFGPITDQSVPWFRVAFHPMTVEFIAGALLAISHQNGPLGAHRFSLLAGTVLWICTLGLPEFERHGLLRPIWYGGSAVLILHGAIGIERLRTYSPPRILVQIGDASYSTYLWHLLIIFGAGSAWVRFFGAPSTWILKVVLIIFLGTLALGSGWILWNFLEVPMQRRASALLRDNRR